MATGDWWVDPDRQVSIKSVTGLATFEQTRSVLTNLPNETTQFVGRTDELAELAAALEEPGLVTVVGGAGMGKSRLALRTVRSRDWAGFTAVCWTDLWPLLGDELLTASVADALNLSDHTSRTLAEVVRHWIADQRVLLVLDSCEHLVEATRDLVASLLSACPRLTVLVTSREPLDVEGERVVGLGPLDPATEALALFESRAATVGRPLRDMTDRLLVERLCAHLEGVPLALELAAGLLHSRTLEETWELAEAGLDALEQPGLRPSRHSALRTAVGWSHELCRPAERLLWARLSVFPGAFDAELAGTVCVGGPLTAQVLSDALAGLVRKSVVTAVDGRYRMLDSVRAYGRMWLRELGEETTVAAGHAAILLETTARARGEWMGSAQQYWYARMRDLYRDVCAAMEFLLRSHSTEALELLGNVAFFWVCSGHLHDVAHFAQLSLPLTSDSDPRRARGLWSLGLARILQGQHAQGRRLAGESLQAAFGAGDAEGVRQAAYLEGLVALLDGAPIEALDRADEALRRQVPMPRDADGGATDRPAAPLTVGENLCRLVRVFALTGARRFNEARQEAEALRHFCVRSREYWTRSYLDYQLALIALFEGRPDEAGAHARDMLDAKRRIGDQFGIAMGLDLLAASWSAQGDPGRAVSAIGASNQFWNAVGLLRRGTPDALPLCESTRAQARELLGDAEYGERLRRARSIAPEALLHTVLEQGRTR
ncbi:AAA family ATPase [Streptomyces sp. NPDC002790]|uniref:ATP-binding protein n=1 Tax=Streptomyces sp. NPDC002790 TaxID=3154431 RepID=UPI00331ABC4F